MMTDVVFKEVSKPTETEILKHDKKFKKYIKEISSEKDIGDRLKTKDLAQRVGISYEMFRKILNQRKPNQTRDCIIAICAALFCTEEETNKALFYYDDLPGLDKREGGRDYIIAQTLDINKKKEFKRDYINKGVELINEALNASGFKRLRISKRTNNENSRKETSSKSPNLFKNIISDPHSHTYSNREYYRTSLCEYYHPHQYMVETWIQIMNSEKECHIKISNIDKSKIEVIHPQEFKIELLDKDTDLYKNYVSILYDLNFKELKKNYEILFDTRNWGSRRSAKLDKDTIVVFEERFNFSIPERREYFYGEIRDNEFTFYIMNQSNFMNQYLNKEDFINFYGDKKIVERKKISSIKEIEDYCVMRDQQELSYTYKVNYIEIKRSLENLIDNLKNEKEFIRDYEQLMDDAETSAIYNYYDVNKEFGCVEQEEIIPIYKEYDPLEEKYRMTDGEAIGTLLHEEKYSFVEATKKEAIFDYKNEKVILTKEDLITAFKLGVDKIEEIIKLKSKITDLKFLYNNL